MIWLCFLYLEIIFLNPKDALFTNLKYTREEIKEYWRLFEIFFKCILYDTK